jgi:hypothetical protein
MGRSKEEEAGRPRDEPNQQRGIMPVLDRFVDSAERLLPIRFLRIVFISGDDDDTDY